MTAAEQVSPPTLDLAAVHTHLSRYFGAPGELSIVSDLDWSGQRFATSNEGLGRAAEYIRDLDVQGAAGIYHRGTTVRPDAPTRGRGRAEHSVSWLAVQLDVDYGKATEPDRDGLVYAPDAATAHGLVLAAETPAPSSWTASGHGLYPVWEFGEPVADSPFLRALVLDLHAAVASAFRASGYRIDAGVTDAARVWRIPGTVNRKDDDSPVRCAVVDRVGSGKPVRPSTLRRAVRADERHAVEMAPTGAAPEMLGGLQRPGRLFTLSEAQVYVGSYALAPLAQKVPGTGVNIALNDAACVVGHFVGGGFLTYGQAMDSLLQACPAGWDEPEPVRRATIRSGLRKGMTEPYVLALEAPAAPPAPESPVAPPVSGLQPATAPISAPPAPITDAQPVAEPAPEWSQTPDHAAVQIALMKLRATQRAREILAAENAEPLRVLRGLEFLRSTQPEYLVPSMFYRASTAKVFGPPGSTKSFLLLDVALSLAAGRTWQGMALPRTRVHYVMAEGQAVNVSRALAWLHDRGVPEEEIEGWFVAVPQGVLLTPEGVAQYLRQVEADRPGLIILDTKNAMMDGDENHASDVAVMVRAMRAVRDASDACVVLVDHTGITDATRGRGSNAVTAAMDTEVKVERGEGGVITATVTRDKAAEDGAAWSYTLRRVEGVPGLRVGAKPPAVCHPANAVEGDDSPFVRSREWWQHDAPVPQCVAELRGDGADCARDIYRVLWFMREHDGGVSMSVLRRAIGARPKAKEPSEPTARRGRVLLEEKGVVQSLSKGSYALTPGYTGEKDTLS